MKARSILIASNGNCFSDTSDEAPVPKSSTTSRTPISCSCRERVIGLRRGPAASVSSVISSHTAPGASPVSQITRFT